jgi:diguanylate cyclase (GGDEF)-like protein/PAS domain S-box-containing protein
MNAMPEGVAVTHDGRIIDVNTAMCEMTGFSREELVSCELPFPFFAPEEVERTDALLRRMRSTDRGDHEISMMRKDGSRFSALVSSGVAYDGEEQLGRVVTFRDISERRRREDRLAELAAKDELTGLLNKRSFLVNLAGEVARARRNKRPLTLAILDLDGFKRINDEAGHMAGDRVLAEAAGRLGALVRQGEHLARVGGDEFGWILPEADAEGAVAAVTRARQAIAGESFRSMGSLSVSAGISVAEGAIDAAELYRRADRALYTAKNAGVGGIEVF